MPAAVPLLVVDAANVVGSVPDGWWRDRAAATARLRDALVPIATRGLERMVGPIEIVLVVEGRARGIAEVDGVRIVRADGSGDDAIVAFVGDAGVGRACFVVTADRELAERVRVLGATVLGPKTVRPNR
jgi:hypothetical protein